jgi:hypothetical protein
MSFSQGDPKALREFFKELTRPLPFAEVVVGEMTAIPARSSQNATSVMPDLLLFIT